MLFILLQTAIPGLILPHSPLLTYAHKNKELLAHAHYNDYNHPIELVCYNHLVCHMQSSKMAFQCSTNTYYLAFQN